MQLPPWQMWQSTHKLGRDCSALLISTSIWLLEIAEQVIYILDSCTAGRKSASKCQPRGCTQKSSSDQSACIPELHVFCEDCRCQQATLNSKYFIVLQGASRSRKRPGPIISAAGQERQQGPGSGSGGAVAAQWGGQRRHNQRDHRGARRSQGSRARAAGQCRGATGECDRPYTESRAKSYERGERSA